MSLSRLSCAVRNVFLRSCITWTLTYTFYENQMLTKNLLLPNRFFTGKLYIEDTFMNMQLIA